MNVSLLSLLTGNTMKGEIAASPTSVACWRFGRASGNEHFHTFNIQKSPERSGRSV